MARPGIAAPVDRPARARPSRSVSPLQRRGHVAEPRVIRREQRPLAFGSGHRDIRVTDERKSVLADKDEPIARRHRHFECELGDVLAWIALCDDVPRPVSSWYSSFYSGTFQDLSIRDSAGDRFRPCDGPSSL